MTTIIRGEDNFDSKSHSIAAIVSDLVSNYTKGDKTKVGVIENGLVVDDLLYLVDPVSLTKWNVSNVTGTITGSIDTITGIVPGLSGVLTNEENTNYTDIAQCVMQSGDISINSTVETLTDTTVLYSGNGGTQDIVTGISSVDFTVSGNGSGYWLDRITNEVKTDAGVVATSGNIEVNTSKVHIKSRTSDDFSNHIHDGLRGVLPRLHTNTTDEEQTTSDSILSFNNNGFTLGSQSGSNSSSHDYVAQQTLYTHISWGLVEDKLYVTAYNPTTSNVMIYYVGTGTTSLKIPHLLGKELDFWSHKRLDTTSQWQTHGSLFDRMFLNATIADNEDVDNFGIYTDTNYLALGTVSADWNSEDGEYIVYGMATASTQIITSYIGDGSSNHFVYIPELEGKTPSKLLFKAITTTSNWAVYDNMRKDSDAWKRLYLNLTTGEASDDLSSHPIYGVSGGVLLGSSNATWNGEGVKYLLIAHVDTQDTGTGSYADLPSDVSTLQVTDGVFGFTNGKDTKGFLNTNVKVSETIDFSAVEDGLQYVAKKISDGTYTFTDKPVINSALSAGKQFIPESGTWFDVNYIADGSTNTREDKATANHTTYESETGIASASSEYSTGHQAWRAFDGAQTDAEAGWLTTSGVVTGWIQYEFKVGVVLNKLEMVSRPYTVQAPKNFSVLASSTGVFNGEETTLFEAVDEVGWESYQARLYTWNNSDKYKYYRVSITANNGSTGGLSLASISFIEAELKAIESNDSYSYLPNPIMVSNGLPQYIQEEDIELPKNVMESTKFSDTTSLDGNVRVLDFGVVTTDDRLVLPNPFGDVDPLSCDVKAEVYVNGIWSETGWIYNSNTTDAYGTTAFSNKEGIVVQVASHRITANAPVGGGGFTNVGSPTSAPCRVKVTYIGEPKYV